MDFTSAKVSESERQKRVRLMANKRSFFQKDHCRRMLADWCLNGSFSLAKRSCPWHFATGRQGLVEILARNSWVSLLPFWSFLHISPFFFLYFFTAKTGPKLVLSGRHTVAVLRSASKRPRVQTPANEIACRSTVQHRSTVDSMLLIGSSYQPRFQELFREKAFAMGFKGHSCPGSWHPMTSENVTGAWQ